MIAVTVVINSTVFIDWLDGLAASCLALACVVVAIQLAAPWPLCSLVVLLLGFLLLNWSPVKVFMGDVVSTFLGAGFTGVVLQ